MRNEPVEKVSFAKTAFSAGSKNIEIIFCHRRFLGLGTGPHHYS